jgi:phosphopantothenoylcysteine synthetase/decarboxylase
MMFRNLRPPVLHLIVCGAGAAGDLESFVKTCEHQGWDVWVVATPTTVAFIDRAALAELTGHPVHVDDLLADEPDSLPRAGAIAVVPAAFETIVKLAFGSTDSRALRLVTEAIALGLPILALPAPDEPLARHPAFAESVARLRAWGVSVLPQRAYHRFARADDVELHDQLPWQAAEELLGQWIRFARVPSAEAA